MKTLVKVIGMTALAAMAAVPSFSQGEKQGQGQVVVTILPKKGGATAPEISPEKIQLKINGKETSITNVIAPKDTGNIELVLLFDSGLRTSLGTQLDEINQFIRTLPPNVKLAVAYMQNGRAVFASPFSTDRQQSAKALHLPSGIPGASASPYFCLSDLAKNWPQTEGPARREVLMVTDGVDNYSPRFDPDDPYVQAAIKDSVRAGIVVYSLYWRDQGRFASSGYANYAGQNLLVQVTEATGGKNFWGGYSNPVSFEPYLEELTRRMQNQYELSFTAPFTGKPQVEAIKVKINAPGIEVASPQQVFVTRPGIAEN
ncbi:MAG TPA: hypothetical protein VL346_07255 [Acidobacteriaceae bacterium]|nr:hypothetical protein [Acidobacteriaceae bacterium]